MWTPNFSLIEFFISACVLSMAISNARNFKKARSTGDTKGGKITRMPSGNPKTMNILNHAMTAILLPFTLYHIIFFGIGEPSWMKLWLDDWLQVPVWLRAVAGVTLALSGPVTGWILETLGRDYAPIGVREKPSIVDKGPYAIVRHPLYGFAVLFSPCVFLALDNPLLIVHIPWVTVLYLIKVKVYEEPMLLDVFGKDYADYMKRVRWALIPGVL
ncbi:hypothetical protein BJ508DRAFT_327531 [Ascobolus immersus RN42]|uniref:Protein-S-isoprenylcysteine O-methyltransferase n=1 Tax=Ascobolus immersus RN42 TaxID=1160509 RepID=A0A3N4I6A6_ASCIM|nr:hypothetical protein BJ508DRAFT_327531 [Ascobolus immersus RN42]